MDRGRNICKLSILAVLAIFIFGVRDISFAAVPSPPTLTSPGNGSNVSGTVVQFRWSQVTDATNYYLQVATDAGFTSIIFGQWIGNYIGTKKWLTCIGRLDNKVVAYTVNRLLKKASTALIAQIRKNDYTDISMGFNL